MATTNEYLNQLKKDKQNLVDNLNDKGVTASNTETFTSLVPKVLDIQSSSSAEYPLNEDMEWAKQICIDDIQEGYTYKVLEMISDCYSYHDIVVPRDCAVKTSDGAYYTSDAKHIWNDSNARVSQSYQGIKLRWIITYYKYESSTVNLFSDVMYAVFNGVHHSSQCFAKHYLLQYFEYINGAKYIGEFYSLFSNCHSLETIPFMDISGKLNISSMFRDCYSLKYVPLLDTSTIIDSSYMFNNCSCLQTVPAFNLSHCTNANGMFYECSGLLKVPDLQLSKASVTSLFYNCYQLQTVERLDVTSATSMSWTFKNCFLLEFLDLMNAKCSFDISFSDMYSKDTLVGILTGLVDLTAQTSQTLTMGTDNLAKLTEEDKLIAINKNWILV